MKKAIIFDLDGTLWNSSEGVAKVWSNLANELGLNTIVTGETMRGCMGKVIEEIFDSIFPEQTSEIKSQFLSLCENKECDYLRQHGGALYPNLLEVLQTLHEHRDLYIVSNCQKGYIESFLTYHKLGVFFRDIECSGNTGQPKASNIQLIMKRNHVKEAIYVGDTAGDQNSAQQAGIPFVYAAYGFGMVDTYDSKINSLQELLSIVDTQNTSN